MPKKEKIGKVVSNKMNKTVVVEVQGFKPHSKYKKIIAETKNYMVDDREEICKEGDEVRIIESRPLSKLKRWTVANIIREAT